MEKGDSEVRNISKNASTLNISNFNETEMIKLIQVLDQKIKLLENKNNSQKALNNDQCIFKDTCYTVKSNSGSCPCEQYR